MSNHKLFEALPVSGRALFLRRDFNHSVKESIVYLLEFCAQVNSLPLYSQALEKVRTLDPEEKVSGLFHLLNVNLYKAIEGENFDEVERIAERLSTESFQSSEINYLTFETVNPYYLKDMKALLTQKNLGEEIFFPISETELKDFKIKFAKGFEILKKSVPELYTESQELISEVLFVSADKLKGGSSFDLWGIICKNMTNQWNKLTDILDVITHEQAHLYVYLLVKNDPLLANPEDIHTSPLRKDPRPLMGIYHATFVIARIFYVLAEALRTNNIPEEEIEYCYTLLEYYKERYQCGFDTLKSHAKMTPLGEGLIDSSLKLVA